jgi:hypothetical protein
LLLELWQCCWDHVAAASAGHLHCLQRLQEQGQFLGLDSPERSSAGEVRKLQVWDAAHSACKAGHAGILSWLFASGWPAEIDAHIPWHLRDLVKPEHWDAWNVPYLEGIRGISPMDKVFLPEVQLCRYAMQNPEPNCLEALMTAGCRSIWLCDMAVLEGKEGYLIRAVLRGCRMSVRSWVLAARAGNLPILQHLRGLAHTRRRHEILWFAPTAARVAAEAGQKKCLKALLQWNTRSLNLQKLSVAAMRRGHLECLKVLLGYVSPHRCVTHTQARARNARLDVCLFFLACYFMGGIW